MKYLTPEFRTLPPQRKFFTIRAFLAAAALASTTLAISLSLTIHQSGIATVAGLALALPLAAVYCSTSRLNNKGRLLLAAAFWASFSIFELSVSFCANIRLDLRMFNESGAWSPMPPEIVAGPLMLIAAGIALLSGYATLRLSNVVDEEPTNNSG